MPETEGKLEKRYSSSYGSIEEIERLFFPKPHEAKQIVLKRRSREVAEVHSELLEGKRP